MGTGFAWFCLDLYEVSEWWQTGREQACLEDLGLLSKMWKSKLNLRDLKAAFISGCAAQKELDVARPCSHCKFPSELKVKDSFPPRSCPTRTVHDEPSPGKHQCFADTYIHIYIKINRRWSCYLRELSPSLLYPFRWCLFIFLVASFELTSLHLRAFLWSMESFVKLLSALLQMWRFSLTIQVHKAND